MNKSQITKLTLLLVSTMTMMAGAVVAPCLPQINNIFSQTPHANILTRLIITLPPLLIALVSIFAGKLSDRIGRKQILLYSLFFYGISGASAFFMHNIYLILISRAFLGISVAGIMTIVIALIGDYYKGDERTKFLGTQAAFMGIGGVVFVALAGYLADFGWQVPFLIYSFGFLVFPLAYYYLYEPQKNETPQNIELKASNNSYSKPLINLIYTLAFIGVVAFYMIPVQIPYLLKTIPGISNSQIGLAIAAQSLTGAIVAMNYKKIKARFTFYSLYQIAFSFMSIGYLYIGLSNSYLHYILGLIISGLGVGLLMPTGNTWIIEVAPAEVRGKLVGKANTAIFIAMFCSPVILQPIINISSLSTAFIFMSIILPIFAVGISYIKKYCKFE